MMHVSKKQPFNAGTDKTDSNMDLRVINKLIKKGNQRATLMEVSRLPLPWKVYSVLNNCKHVSIHGYRFHSSIATVKTFSKHTQKETKNSLSSISKYIYIHIQTTVHKMMCN